MTGFLDLSAEMRNNIYDLVLSHDRSQGRLANVALLRVCRHINNEASPMLPGMTTFNVRITSDPEEVPSEDSEAYDEDDEEAYDEAGDEAHDEDEEPSCDNDTTPALNISGDISARISEFPDSNPDYHFPSVLIKAARVDIELDLNDPNIKNAKMYFWRLVERLQSGEPDEDKRDIKVTLLSEPEDSFDGDMNEFLSPLEELKEEADIELVGFSAEVEDMFWQTADPYGS